VNGTYQLLIYDNDVNLLGVNIHRPYRKEKHKKAIRR